MEIKVRFINGETIVEVSKEPSKLGLFENISDEEINNNSEGSINGFFNPFDIPKL